MTNLDTAKQALAVLNLEELNTLLPFYNNLLRMNRHEVASDMVAVLNKGDKVTIHNIRPAHMNGREGEVIFVKKTKVHCKFPGTQWEYGVTVPASCLTKVN